MLNVNVICQCNLNVDGGPNYFKMAEPRTKFTSIVTDAVENITFSSGSRRT